MATLDTAPAPAPVPAARAALPAGARPAPFGLSRTWLVFAGLILASIAWFVARRLHAEPFTGSAEWSPLAWLGLTEPVIVATYGEVYFRLILPAEILAIMVAVQVWRALVGGGVSANVLRIAVPAGTLLLFVANWQFYTEFASVPHYILPSPTRVAEAFATDWEILVTALWVTLRITFAALAIALVGGVALAVLMSESRWVELAVYPYAVILQVTPIVAIAPLILIYTETTQQALLICAWIVAFFPVLSNTTQGLRSTDHNLLNLFELYGASRWQTLIHLKLPNALPYFLAGLRIAGGLALIAAVVAEFAAGTAGGNSGLAFRLLESHFRLNIPRLFSALVLLSLTGIVIFFATSFVSWLLLRKWHESAVRREN